MKKMLRDIGIVAVSLLLAGCRHLDDGQPSIITPAGLHPNYETPDSEFVPAKFSALSSEFLDEYAGQYVVVDGRYLQSSQGALIYQRSGRPYNASDMMSAMIGSSETFSARPLSIIWSQQDRELARPFVDCALTAPVKIYAYVLPANQPAQLKSRPDTKLKGFPVPVILLIKAVPGKSQ